MNPPVVARPSPNERARPDGVAIDTLVLHYTGMRSAEAALERLCDPASEVSSHYLVDEAGTVFGLVDERRRAAHAGVSHWRGREDLNDSSIGIEIVNPGHEWGYRDFPDLQIDAVMALCRAILARHPIDPRRVVGHSDIAPDRKQDPGERFPWGRLAAAGIGVAVPLQGPTPEEEPASADAGEMIELLAEIGYRTRPPTDPRTSREILISAFQRRWRPARVDGRMDRQTVAIARAVAAAYRAEPHVPQ